jgi:hypothetical protein
MAEFAIRHTPTDGVPTLLNNNIDTVVARIQLFSGTWVIFGKVVIANFDGDPQNANAQMLAQDSNIILDQADFRIPGGNSFGQCIAMQGTLFVGQGNFAGL